MPEVSDAAVDIQQPLWSWRFHSVGALRDDGLEQYTEFLENVVVARYAPVLGDESTGKEHTCAMRKRAEIDACMGALPYPWFHRLLDLYYRQGKSCEQHGWCEVAKLIGLRGDASSRWDKDTFEVQVTLGIGRLWRVHEDRWQRKA